MKIIIQNIDEIKKMYSEQEWETLKTEYSQCDEEKHKMLPEDKAFIENNTMQKEVEE